MTVLHSRRVVERASALLIAGALAACSPAPWPATPDPSGRTTARAKAEAAGETELLVLLGVPGHMRLAWLDDVRESPVPLPEDDVRWVAGSAAQGLVMTTGPTGRILVTGPLASRVPPAWREVPIDPGGRQWLGQPLADAVPDPTGGAIAAVAADPASGFADGHLVILDRTTGAAHALAFPERWDGRAPAWLGSGNVAISSRGASDATELTVVDPATGERQHWGSRVGAFAVSGDGLTLAWQDRDDRRVLAAPLDRVLANAPPEPLPADPGARLAAQLLLEESGRRIAVAWLDDAGDTTGYSVYERGERGWAIGRAGALPRGTSRAVLVAIRP